MTTKGTFQTVLGGQGEENLSDYDTTTDIDQWGNVAYDNGITPESTVGVNIGEAGSGTGDDGGFNVDGGYLNFNDTKSQIIIPKIDLTIYDEIVVTAIRGNGSNGGISPTATYGDLELLWATPRSNINDGTPSYLYPNMNENGVNQASGTVAEFHQKYNQFIPSNNVFWKTYDPSDTGLRDWAVPIPEWMRFEDVALIIGKYNNTTGGVKSVYCHYDGYPEYVGKILVNHYNTPEKVTKLISMGDISSLEKSIGKKHDFNMPYNEKEKLGYTTFYHRDRGDELRINSNKSIKEYLLDANERWADYVYIYWGTKGDDTPTATKGWEYIQPYG